MDTALCLFISLPMYWGDWTVALSSFCAACDYNYLPQQIGRISEAEAKAFIDLTSRGFSLGSFKLFIVITSLELYIFMPLLITLTHVKLNGISDRCGCFLYFWTWLNWAFAPLVILFLYPSYRLFLETLENTSITEFSVDLHFYRPVCLSHFSHASNFSVLLFVV